jgi:GNAT superfamily N-acetyltransferase
VTFAKQIEIVPIALEHVDGFHRALDSVARERKYLSVFEAFSVRAMRDFVLHQNKTSGPAFVAHRAGEVIGWCDIRRHALPAFAHRGSVGMGVVAEWRRRGIGFRLLDAALDAAFRQGFASNSRCAPTTPARSRSTTRLASCAKESFGTRFSSTANISTPSPWRSSASHRSPPEATTFAIWNTPLPAVVFGPVIANGSFTSTQRKDAAMV